MESGGLPLYCVWQELWRWGFLIACMHMYRNRYSKNFVDGGRIPVIVQAVIMLVNGSLGTGVAVMGAFSLVRFRSVPGNSREIGSIFLAMARDWQLEWDISALDF